MTPKPKRQTARPKRTPATDLVALARDARRIAIRAGSQPHKLTSLWAVVAEDRIFIRSWSLKPRSWFRTLRVEPHGIARIGAREIPFRSVNTRNERLRAAVDRAYVAKYDLPGDIPYTRDMTGAKSRATTTELILATGRR